jgi:hypothetical protein
MNRVSLRKRLKSVRDLAKGFRVQQVDAEKHLLSVAQELWYRLDTPTSLGLYLCAKYGDILSILKHEVDPKGYTSSESFYLDHQAVGFLKKCPLSAVALPERESSAIDKFRLAESMCRETNIRFRSRMKGLLASSPVESVLFRAQQKIFSWIGEGPNPHAWASRCRFGPGSDDLTKGHRVGAYHKLSALSATADFADGALALALDHPAWSRSLLGIDPFESPEGFDSFQSNVTSGNEVVFVPKNALTERSIAVEPRMNVYAQLGLGDLLRTSLRNRAGLDLNTQDLNQDLAYDASVHGHLATIDLSMASDTMSIEVVRDLLPIKWFNALDWCRSKKGFFSWTSSWEIYEKFSSMGNGYTFELETMLFLALARACNDHLGIVNHYTRVYGDDIICPVEAVALLEEVLVYCGFKVNTTKSFSSGCFRESCGADFFDGTNVRPHFCKEVPTDAKSLFNLANGIRRAGHRLGHGKFCDRRFRPAWLRTVHRIPRPLRELYTQPVVSARVWGISFDAGDGGLVLNPDEFLASSLTRFCREWNEGFYFGTLVDRAWHEREDLTTPSTLYAYALYRCKDGFPPDLKPGIVSGRGSVGVRLNLRAYTRRVEDLGPWL